MRTAGILPRAVSIHSNDSLATSQRPSGWLQDYRSSGLKRLGARYRLCACERREAGKSEDTTDKSVDKVMPIKHDLEGYHGWVSPRTPANMSVFVSCAGCFV